jgi:cytochrome c oxidase cbb3-type subunit IV
MFRQFFADMPLTELPLFALGVFLTVFLGVLARTLLWKRAADYQSAAQLPLEEQPAPHSASHEATHG